MWPEKIYLASQSPRRRELLRQIGIEPEIVDVVVAEIRSTTETAEEYVARVARDKAVAGFARLCAQGLVDALVLGADTEVVLDGEVFGKPRDAEDCARMLSCLSGRWHEVLSAVHAVGRAIDRGLLCRSKVKFAELAPSAIEAYAACGEGLGKAGAYAIQGRGALFVESIAGSYSGIMGLPLHETGLLLENRAREA